MIEILWCHLSSAGDVRAIATFLSIHLCSAGLASQDVEMVEVLRERILIWVSKHLSDFSLLLGVIPGPVIWALFCWIILMDQAIWWDEFWSAHLKTTVPSLSQTIIEVVHDHSGKTVHFSGWGRRWNAYDFVCVCVVLLRMVCFCFFFNKFLGWSIDIWYQCIFLRVILIKRIPRPWKKKVHATIWYNMRVAFWMNRWHFDTQRGKRTCSTTCGTTYYYVKPKLDGTTIPKGNWASKNNMTWYRTRFPNLVDIILYCHHLPSSKLKLENHNVS